jgi:hypothetical protein
MEEAMNFKRFAAATLTIVLTLAISPRPAFASEKTDVVAAVHRYLDNLETDKLETALVMCDSQASILDEFPPHEWHGPTACADWWKALLAYRSFEADAGWLAHYSLDILEAVASALCRCVVPALEPFALPLRCQGVTI